MNKIVELALRQRVLILMLLAGLIVAGAVAFANLNIEAYPDPVPPMVEVVTQKSRHFRGGDRAQRHHPDRGADCGYPSCDDRAVDLALRPFGRPHPVQL